MNILNEVINHSYPNAALSCRECGRGGKNIIAREDSQVSADNVLGERRLEISCAGCGLTDHAIEPENVRSTVKAWLFEEVRLYTCTYMFRGLNHKTISTKGIGKFVSGFWVNAYFEYTSSSDCVYWIPPGKIEYIAVKTEVRRLSE